MKAKDVRSDQSGAIRQKGKPLFRGDQCRIYGRTGAVPHFDLAAPLRLDKTAGGTVLVEQNRSRFDDRDTTGADKEVSLPGSAGTPMRWSPRILRQISARVSAIAAPLKGAPNV